MFDLIKELINLKKLDMKEGEISLLGTNLCLIPPDVYVLLLKELQKMNKQKVLYESSKKSSISWFRNLTTSLGKRTVNELIDFLPKTLNLLGLGAIEIDNKDLGKKEFLFSLYDSLTAERYGKSKSPVDLQVSGFLAGSLEFILNTETSCAETECMSQGYKKCTFVVKTVE